MPVRTMPALTDDLLIWALWYGEMGLPIFPAHTVTPQGCSCWEKDACTKPGKHPRDNGWQAAATADPAQIERWWTSRRYRASNIALATGRGGWILDEDPAKGGTLSLEALIDQHGPLPPTPVAHTGGYGRHYWLEMPVTSIIGNRTNVLPGLDTRGAGGLIILPPSRHVTGRPYAWDGEHDLETTPLPLAPDWLVALVQQPQASSSPSSPDASILDGARNNTLSKMAFDMRKAGISLDGVLAALLAENARCVPPLTHGGDRNRSSTARRIFIRIRSSSSLRRARMELILEPTRLPAGPQGPRGKRCVRRAIPRTPGILKGSFATA